jgi:hypothetical protein
MLPLLIIAAAELTPSASDIGPLVERYGLPLVVLVLLIAALWRRVFILGSENERDEKAHQAELARIQAECAATATRLSNESAYREALRLEERAGRRKAEERLELSLVANRELTAAYREAERERLRDILDRGAGNA